MATHVLLLPLAAMKFTAFLMILLPLGAMQFTNEVAWDGTDFAIFGAMLLSACGVYELYQSR
jgi:hypothetical protein